MKGIYLSLTSDPPNPKIKDWNVTELKVRSFLLHLLRCVEHFLITSLRLSDRREQTTRRQVRRRTVLEDIGRMDVGQQAVAREMIDSSESSPYLILAVVLCVSYLSCCYANVAASWWCVNIVYRLVPG